MIPEQAVPMPPEYAERLNYAAGKGVVVAVVDSGWDATIRHSQVREGVSFIRGPREVRSCLTDTADEVGHGTACAELILTLAPQARILPVRIFDKSLETSPEVLCAAIEWIIDSGSVDVVNFSLGTRHRYALRPLLALCERAAQAGMVLVAAGAGPAHWSYPAVFERVIGVAAAKFESPWHFLYEPNSALECVGQGIGQRVSWYRGVSRTVSGTSYAAAHIAGIVATIRETRPGCGVDYTRTVLQSLATSRT